MSDLEVGIDLVELNQIKDKMTKRFVERVLSETELSKYHQINHPQRRLTFLAGRFAAKEAYVKVYKRFDAAINFKDVSVLSDASGAPYIVSKYRSEDSIKVSISHTDHYAVAICIKQ
jgi:holo-[acyl-carrier protein] synthase